MAEWTIHFPVDEFRYIQFHSAGAILIEGNQARTGSLKEYPFFHGKVPGQISLRDFIDLGLRERRSDRRER